MHQSSTSISTEGNEAFQSNRQRRAGNSSRHALPMVAGQSGEPFHLAPCREEGSGYAQRAYVVFSWEPPGKRLSMIERGLNGRRWVSLLPEANGGNSRSLQRLANHLNKAHGLSSHAAQALFVDWQCEFKNPPINPADYAAYKSDDRLVRKAKCGSPSSQAVSAGYLRFRLAIHYSPPNNRIYESSLQYIWLMAHFELDWARWHGRSKTRDMLKSERAARRLWKCASALQTCGEGYTTRYSRFWQVFSAQHGNPDLAATIAARRNDRERRAMLLEVRAKRRRAFKALFAAIRSYHKARAALATA
jgi:hypothetical protein